MDRQSRKVDSTANVMGDNSEPQHDAATKPPVDRAARREIIEGISKLAAAKVLPGPCAARSQDFLYDDFGIPI